MNDIIAIAEDILSRFTITPDGYRARAGRVQFGKWREQLDQAIAANAAVPLAVREGLDDIDQTNPESTP